MRPEEKLSGNFAFPEWPTLCLMQETKVTEVRETAKNSIRITHAKSQSMCLTQGRFQFMVIEPMNE